MTQPPPLRISRRLIRSITITRMGWGFIFLTIGLGGAALNTGNNLLYLVFGILLSMLLINGILSNSSLYNLEIQLVFPHRLFANSNNPVKVEIVNRKRTVPSYALNLELHTQEKRQSHFIFKISAGEQRHSIFLAHYTQRGRRMLPALRLSTSYPFGLIEKHIPIGTGSSRIVFPQLRPETFALLQPSFERGEFLSGKRGHGINPYGVREFTLGDDVRHIHWASSAKVGQWMTKEFELEKRPRIAVHLLMDDQPQEIHERREEIISIAATILVQCIERHHEVALYINNRPIRPSGSGYIDFYLTALALFDTEGALTRPEPLQPLHEQGMVVVLSDLPSSHLSSTPNDLLVTTDHGGT